MRSSTKEKRSLRPLKRRRRAPGDAPAGAADDQLGSAEEPAAPEPEPEPEPGAERAPRGLDEGAPAETVREWLRGRPLPARAHLLLGLLLPLTIAAINMGRVWAHTVDDAYISFRYARNLARGLGLVYNEGERIEGYTNFLWTVLLAGGIKIGLDPVVVAKVLGTVCGCGTLLLVYYVSARLLPLTTVPCIATWLLASTGVFTGYAVFGLETSMFACLVLAGTYVMLREEERGREQPAVFPWSGLLFAAAGLTRPEAPMYLGLMMMFLAGKGLWPLSLLVGRSPSRGRAPTIFGALFVIAAVLLTRLTGQSTAPALGAVEIGVLAVAAALLLLHLPRALFGRRNLLRGALFVGPVAAHLLWRHSYYGRWLPNTLGAKTGDFRAQLQGGLDYVLRYLDHEGPVLYLALFGVAAGLAWRSRHLLAISSVVVSGITYVVLVGGDWMPLFRFIAPIQPFCFLLIGVGVRGLLKQRRKLISYGLIMALLLAVAQRISRLNQSRAQILREEKHFWDMAAGGTAQWFLDRAQQQGDGVKGAIALGDIGQVGYDTDWPILDLLGLVDPVIAELPGGYTNKIGPGFRDRFFAGKPRYFILISAENDCQHPSVTGSRALYSDPRFLQQYALSGRIRLDRGFSWCVYERRDLRGDLPSEDEDEPAARPGPQHPSRLRLPKR